MLKDTRIILLKSLSRTTTSQETWSELSIHWNYIKSVDVQHRVLKVVVDLAESMVGLHFLYVFKLVRHYYEKRVLLT